MNFGQMVPGHFLQNQNAHMIIVQAFLLTSDISEFEVLIRRSVIAPHRTSAWSGLAGE